MIKLILLYLAVIYITFVHYGCVMAMRVVRDNKRIPKGMRPFYLLVLAIGLVFDFLLNMIMSLPLLELPQEILLTIRFQRLIKEGGWRGKIAQFFCVYFLTPFDENHCG